MATVRNGCPIVLFAMASAVLFSRAGVLVASARLRTHHDALVGSKSTQESKSRGQVVFDRICGACHGPKGRGDAAPRLVPFDREFEDVLSVVREGRGQMAPISAGDISDEEVAQVVQYLRLLTKQSHLE